MTAPAGDGAPTISDDEAQLHLALAASAEEVEKWKSFSRQHEERAKANAKAAEQLAELQKNGMTDPQKVLSLQGEIAQLQAQFKQGQLENARLAIVAKHGLTPEDASFLTGETPDEIDASAARLAARIGATPNGQQQQRMPDLRQGPRGPAGQAATGSDILRSLARPGR